MKLFFRLFRVQLNQRFGFSAIRAGWQENRKKALGHALIYGVALLSIALLLGMYSWLLVVLMQSFHALNMEKVFLGAVLLISMILVFFMGLIYLIGVLFFSRDTEFLAALPVPQHIVFASKFAQVMLGEVVTSAAILLPAFLIYGITMNMGAMFYARAVLILLFTPCIPLALSGILSLLLMRFSALWRRRDLLTIVGTVLLIVIIFVGQGFFSATMPAEMSSEAMTELLADSSALLHQVSSAFPPSAWTAEGLAQGGANLLLFLAVSVAGLLLVMLVASRLYYGGAMAQLEALSSQKNVSLEGKHIRQRTTLHALFLREWRIVLRTPVYALNGLIVVLVGPLLFLLPMLMQGASSGSAEMDMLFSLLQNQLDERVIILILAGIFVVIGMINPAASTCLSREGKQFYLMRILPVSPEKQMLAKFLFGFSVSAITMLFMGGVSIYALNIPTTVAAWSFALGMLACVAPIALSQIPDAVKPKLVWNSETEAIKQNMNGMLGMLIGLVYVVAVFLGGYLLLNAGMDALILILLAVGISVILGSGALYALCRLGKRSVYSIEG